MKLRKFSLHSTLRRSARLALAGLLLLSIILLPAGAQAGRFAAGKDPVWGASLKNTPAWLRMADTPDQIYSEYELRVLAGRLIANKSVDASDCPGSGLSTDGSANVCGLQRGLPAVFAWQNQFNASIVDTSNQTGIPPVLLKNIFTWESQFWPQTVYVNTYEYGLGHITEMGADSALRWNAPFYDQICDASLSRDTCKKDYIDQPDAIRASLRGVVVQQVKADCSGCDFGLDMPLAERSIPIFAQTLLANASFVKWYVSGLTGHPAADSIKYEDLWKFTLTSYNAGPGCFMTAFSRTLGGRLALDWDNLSDQLDPGCAGSRVYVDFISKTDHYHPENDPSLLLPTPTETVLETVVATVTETATPSPTPTLDGSQTATETVVVTVVTVSETASATATTTATPQLNGLPTDLSTPLATETPTVVTGSETPTATGSETPTWIPTETATEVATTSATLTETVTVGVTEAATASATPRETATEVAAPTETATATETETATATLVPAPVDLTTQLEPPHMLNEVLLKINPLNRDAALETLKSLGISLSQDSSLIDSLDTLVIQVEPAALETVLAALQASGGVEFAEPNYLAALASTLNDPEFPRQGNLQAMQIPQTWDALPSMQVVVVAVVDTGVDVNHPDLYDSIWQNPGETGLDANGNDRRTNGLDDDGNGYVDDWQGWNMLAGNNNPADDQAHGTHLAGMIAAGVNNAIGMAGIAPNARILPVKVLDSTGYGTYAQVAEGIVYATDMGARVINLGFGGTGSSELLQNAIDYALTHNALVVASAGNDGKATTFYPAGYPGVLAVSAVDNNGYWANFSSTGGHISLAAPGIGIYSTTPGGFYRSMSGTSISAAAVSGVAALLAGQPQFPDGNSLRSALVGAALDRGDPGRDPYFGYGVVQAFDALAYSGPVLPTPTPWAVPTSTPGGVGGVFAMATDSLWATGQVSSYALSAPSVNSIDSAFNDAVTSVTGAFASPANFWQFAPFNPPTAFTTVATTQLDLRFYATNWTDDRYCLEVYDISNPSLPARWSQVALITPPAVLTTVTIDVTAILNTPARVNGARFRINGGCSIITGAADVITLSIDEVRLRVLDAIPTATPTPIFMPTSTLSARGITATPQAFEPHNNFVSNTDQCAKCHRSHTAQSFFLRSDNSEEKICFSCHKSGGSGTNVQPAFTSETNSLTRFFSHPVANTVNIHTPEETLGSSFGGANRHVECEDCHKPHESSRVAATSSNAAPAAQQEMFNSDGVSPSWTVSGAASAYAWLPTAQREYEICMKCHSSYTTLPAYAADGYGWDGSNPAIGFIANGLGKLNSTNPAQVLDSRDMAREFNPYQLSFHPVAALGRNRNMPAGSLVPGWTQDSIIYCADCHTNANAPVNGNGPHGSPLLHLLDGGLSTPAQYITKTDPASVCLLFDGCPSIQDPGELCFKCHQYNTYAIGGPASTTNFRNGTQNLHSLHAFGSCYTCHDTHGSEQAHLINFDTSVVTILAGNSQTAWQWNSATGTGTCAVACHSGFHGPAESYKP